ncbi:ABC transporter ATP-binding protein OS=Streptomyces microflavus OX=1919 GN=Smic_44240 PE=4 SV=1 [Streptomyces microflavus]
MASVTFDKASRVYPGSTKPAVDQLEIDIADGEFLVLVGPSGCGKSTSLRMLAGLEDVNGGAIRIGDRDVTHLPPKDRDIAMVFQNYALYPHMSVADNMGFALKIAGINKTEIRAKVEEAAKMLDLTDYLDRKPKALSGGQRQRGPGPVGRRCMTAAGTSRRLRVSTLRRSDRCSAARLHRRCCRIGATMSGPRSPAGPGAPAGRVSAAPRGVLAGDRHREGPDRGGA